MSPLCKLLQPTHVEFQFNTQSRSLSLANRDSYAQISSQLDLLNQRVQNRVEVSLCLNRSNSTSERRFLHNTEDYVLAIRAFHKSARTTAGTVQGHSEHGRDTTGGTNQYESSSVVFRMPTRKRHEIVTLLQRNEKQELLSTTPTALQVNDAKAIASPLDGPQLAPLRINPTMVLTDGFSKLAHKAIQDLDFLGAETFLRRAMEQHKNTGVDSFQHRRLRKQLSLSLFFQGRDKDAKELILDLAEHYGEGLNTTSQLLFALALSRAHDMEFDEARTICEQLCQIRCISDDGSSGMLSKYDVFRLLVTCYRQSRDWMSANAIIAEIPEIDEDLCVPSPLEYILGSDDLILEFLGDAECRTTPSLFVSQVQSLPVAKRVTRLQERLDGASLFTTRFATSETGDDRGGDGLLRMKSRRFQTARQPVETGPENKHASLHAMYARLSASLKHLACKSRLHSSFELLQWQRCTPEVEKMTPARDILSWIEGQAAGHGMTPVTDRFSDDADYSLDISGLPALLLPELDSNEITTAVSLPQSEVQFEASRNLPLASSPAQCTNTGISVVPRSPRASLKAGLTWDPSSLAWICLSDPTLPALAWDDSSENSIARTPLRMKTSYPPQWRPIPEETELHELCDFTAPDRTNSWDECDEANNYSASEREMESEVCYYLRQALEVISNSSNFNLIDGPSSGSSSWMSPSCAAELSGLTFPELGPNDLTMCDSPKPSETSITYSKIIGNEPNNRPLWLECKECQWRPDRPTAFPGRTIKRWTAIMEKHIRRIHSFTPSYNCPICYQNFKNRPDNVKPHVRRKHPLMLSSLYPTTASAARAADIRNDKEMLEWRMGKSTF